MNKTSKSQEEKKTRGKARVETKVETRVETRSGTESYQPLNNEHILVHEKFVGGL